MTCCAPMPAVRGQDSRSSGRDHLAGGRGLAVVHDLPAEQSHRVLHASRAAVTHVTREQGGPSWPFGVGRRLDRRRQNPAAFGCRGPTTGRAATLDALRSRHGDLRPHAAGCGTDDPASAADREPGRGPGGRDVRHLRVRRPRRRAGRGGGRGRPAAAVLGAPRPCPPPPTTSSPASSRAMRRRPVTAACGSARSPSGWSGGGRPAAPRGGQPQGVRRRGPPAGPVGRPGPPAARPGTRPDPRRRRPAGRAAGRAGRPAGPPRPARRRGLPARPGPHDLAVSASCCGSRPTASPPRPWSRWPTRSPATARTTRSPPHCRPCSPSGTPRGCPGPRAAARRRDPGPRQPADHTGPAPPHDLERRMSTDTVEVRPGVYYDSVSLMQVSRDVAAVEGVAAAQVAMATELNLDLLRGMGFTPPSDAGPNDLVVAVRAEDDDALARAVAATRAGARGGLRREQRQLRRQRAATAHDRVRGPPRRRCRPRPGVGARAARVLRGDGRARCRPLGAGLQRQRPGRGRGAAQGRGRGPRPAGDGTGLRHRGRRRRRARLRQRRPPGPGRHRRRQRHRRAAAHVPARHPRRGRQPLPRRRWPRPVRGGRRPVHAGRARSARRRPRDRARRAGVQAAGPGRRRRDHGVRRVAEHARAARAARRGAGRPDHGRPPGGRGSSASTWREPWSSDEQPAPPSGGALRGLFAGGTLCDEAMVIAVGRARRGAVQHPAAPGVGARRGPRARPATPCSTSATTRSPRAARTR